MTVIVYAEDKSGRIGFGQYTVPSIEQAFANFSFADAGDTYFSDVDGEEPLSASEALAVFKAEGEVTFYNDEGEKVRFTLER